MDYKLEEYSLLTSEIAKHQEYALKTMTVTMTVVGGLLGFTSSVDWVSIAAGIIFVLVSSLLYQIAVARKIFLISAYISVTHEDNNGTRWQEIARNLHKKFPLWSETQVFALIYGIDSLGLYVYVTVKTGVWVVTGIAFVIIFALSVVLFLIPTFSSRYRKHFSEIFLAQNVHAG